VSSSSTPARVVAITADAELERTLGMFAALLGLGFGLAAFAYEPFLNGTVGIALGLAGKHAGSRWGRVTIAVAMLGTILGPTFGSVVYAALFLS
jgi:hypothetical protein